MAAWSAGYKIASLVLAAFGRVYLSRGRRVVETGETGTADQYQWRSSRYAKPKLTLLPSWIEPGTENANLL